MRPKRNFQRHFKPECLGGTQVHDQLDLGRLFDGQIGGLRAFEDSLNV